ncbi:MAG: TonB C-terminal domain-containing protein [Hyphomicrobium sp.]
MRGHLPAIATGFVGLLIIAALVLWFRSGDSAAPPIRVQEITIIPVIPPPPPPPAPPPPAEQPVQEEKMVEQTPVTEPEIEEEKPVEEPKDEPPAEADAPPLGPLGLDAEGEGPGDSFNLAGRPGGSPFGAGGGGGSRWGWYASRVQSEIEQALRRNEATRSAVVQVQLQIWADSSGVVNRVRIVSSSGDAAIDDAIRRILESGLSLGAPPQDMPMPIVTRISARRTG